MSKKKESDSQKNRITETKDRHQVASEGTYTLVENSTNNEKTLKRKFYERELARLQLELIKLQEHIKNEGLKVVVIFEGRDTAGKGGTIKRITEALNPRICKVVALGTPTEREKTQWYFQRYVAHLPAAGEMVMFDRSWYNRAGVERVMDFCSDEEYQEFLRSCPEFERMLVRSGVVLIKYWLSVDADEQARRFQARIENPSKRWKISEMDLEARKKWVDYSRAKDDMFKYTDIKQAPWFVVESHDKRRARLNCISHLLSQIPYEDLRLEPIKLPPLQSDQHYIRPPRSDQTYVPEIY
ncbi:MAG: polyphosphate kinase 2 [Candidatus Poribacteria bacterium]|nr:polyphosphate kinase 2 [Candidatus Poribacteria bacterium]